MTDPLVIENAELAQQLMHIAKQEQRSIEEVIFSMVTQYRPQPAATEIPETEDMARSVRLVAYQQARAYWRQFGNAHLAEMTDEQLDEVFWLFDADGIPRLKADKNDVKLPESSLHHAGEVMRSARFRSGQKDISTRSRDILNDEFATYLLSRMKQSTDESENSTSTG